MNLKRVLSFLVLFALLISCASVTFAASEIDNSVSYDSDDMDDLDDWGEDSDDLDDSDDWGEDSDDLDDSDDWGEDSDDMDDSDDEDDFEFIPVDGYPVNEDDFWKCGGSTVIPIPVGDGQIIYIGRDICYDVPNIPKGWKHSNESDYANSVHINKTSTSHNESDKVNSSSSANSESMQFNSSGYSTSSNGNDANIDEFYEAGSSSSASGYDNLKTGISQSVDFGSYTKDIESRHVLKSINPVVIGNNESQDDSNTSVDKKIDNPIENTGSMEYIGLLGLLMGLLLSILLLI